MSCYLQLQLLLRGGSVKQNKSTLKHNCGAVINASFSIENCIDLLVSLALMIRQHTMDWLTVSSILLHTLKNLTDLHLELKAAHLSLYCITFDIHLSILLLV